MRHDPAARRSAYQSPDALLAEAQRIAADIRRRAERDANAVRREAAEWASATRREAERHRERVLAELQHAIAVSEEQPILGDAHDDVTDAPGHEVDLRDDAPGGDRVVIDLRTRTGRTDPTPATDDDPPRTARHPASGGTQVVGHPSPPVETSIETKVHDVVRLAVRRTFDRTYP